LSSNQRPPACKAGPSLRPWSGAAVTCKSCPAPAGGRRVRARRLLSALLFGNRRPVFASRPLTTLSAASEAAQAATHLGEKGDVYLLDEPTAGLHLADVEQLLGLLDRLVDSGKSVIVIEHHQAVMAHADWIIDLGPGAGHDGGRIVFEGTPADLVAAGSTLTGEHLAPYVGT
jgi:ABC-type sugar transport system ATPase subunit